MAVAGSVGRPAIYELKQKTTLADVLQFADGLSPLASLHQVLLERIDDGSSLQVRHVPWRPKELQIELQNGDIVRLLPVVPRFQNAVTLRGNVADPGRFPWHEGMHISDLIPNKESLLTRDYWNGRNALGSAEGPMIDDQSETTAPSSQVAGSGPSASSEAPEVRLLKSGGLAAGSFQEQKRDTQADTSLGAATGLPSLPPLRTFNPRFTVQPAVPEINWDYAVIERMDQSLSTSAIPFNLGKLVLAHDASQDLMLYPGDVVTIFSKADFAVPRSQQVTQVRIEGEIAMGGIYSRWAR